MIKTSPLVMIKTHAPGHVFSPTKILRQTIKQYARSQYAPLLTRISFEVRSSHLEGQILTKNHQYEQIHVEKIQGRNLLRKKKLRDAPQQSQGLLPFI